MYRQRRGYPPPVYLGANIDAKPENAKELGQDGKPATPQLLLGVLDALLLGLENARVLRWWRAEEGSMGVLDGCDDVAQFDRAAWRVVPGGCIEVEKVSVGHSVCRIF